MDTGVFGIQLPARWDQTLALLVSVYVGGAILRRKRLNGPFMRKRFLSGPQGPVASLQSGFSLSYIPVGLCQLGFEHHFSASPIVIPTMPLLVPLSLPSALRKQLSKGAFAGAGRKIKHNPDSSPGQKPCSRLLSFVGSVSLQSLCVVKDTETLQSTQGENGLLVKVLSIPKIVYF